jgi:hypothetical protein
VHRKKKCEVVAAVLRSAIGVIFLRFAICLPASESSLRELEFLLKRPIIGTNQPLEEVQAYPESLVLPMPRAKEVRNRLKQGHAEQPNWYSVLGAPFPGWE